MAIISNKNNSAFTLAELMVIMAVMTVIIAAVAPVFTSRYTNASLDRVWSLVSASNNDDIYADAPTRSMMQQVFIGATPIDKEDIKNTYRPNSKLVVRSSNKINGSSLQKQIEFKYGDNSKGYLFAGNTNLLLGSNYPNLSFTYNRSSASSPSVLKIGPGASGNTALGVGALNSLTSGSNNSAFGYNALNSLTTGTYNTSIGYNSGKSLTTGAGNVFVGYNSYNNSSGLYNTIIGNNTLGSDSASNYTTAVGNNILVHGDHDVALGGDNHIGGNYNTALGYGALKSTLEGQHNNFEYNTAIGYNSCSGISLSAKNKTCIGGVGIDETNMSSTAQALFNDEVPRVFIGKSANKYNSAATLEVHSLSTANSKHPYPGSISGAASLNDSSVIVNGNLIVRGQTYMIGRSPFPVNPSNNNVANTISLMGYRLYKESILSHKPIIGLDGSENNKRIIDENHYIHQSYAGREHCICTYSCGLNEVKGRDSYDWSSINAYPYLLYVNNNGTSDASWQAIHVCGSDYNTSSTSANNIELDNARNITNYTGLDSNMLQALYGGNSCCPILNYSGIQIYNTISSDLGLKNIDSLFTDGINKLSKLKIYNYTFKSDEYKLPHVGVIAQDLKSIFPRAVSKDSNGYYKIRTDDMFYAAINAVKELNANIINLNTKITGYFNRLNKLQTENKILKDKLLKLSKELEILEKE